MNRFIVILLTISFAGDILFLLFLLLDCVFKNYDAIVKNLLMKGIFLFFFIPAISVPFIYFIKISPVVHYTRGGDIQMWIMYTSNSEYIFKQNYSGMGMFIFYVWLIVFFIVFCRTLWLEKGKLDQISILSKEETNEKINKVKENIINELHINRDIRIYRTNLVVSPCVCGILQPKIILPNVQYSETDIELILRHELYHYKKHDIIFHLLLFLFFAFYWFNPLIKLITKQLHSLCEMSCDQLVLKNSSKERKIAYAKLLIQSFERVGESKYNRLTSFTSQGERIIKKRLYSIMKENSKIDKKMLAGVIVFLCVLCPVTTLAATLGVTTVYNQILAHTNFFAVSQVEYDEEEAKRLLKEYTESIKEVKTFTLDNKISNTIDFKIAGNEKSTSKEFEVKKGNSIKIMLLGEQIADQFRVVIKEGQKQEWVRDSNQSEVNYTYTADETANYTIIIKNLNSTTLHISGSILVRS